MSRTTEALSPAPGTGATPTAAQKIVAAMWTIGKPGTTKDIAAAAGVGYSTATPILRHLLATDQAVRTESPQGTTEWQLTATLTGTEKPPATFEHDPVDVADSDSAGSAGADPDLGIDASSELKSVPTDTNPVGTAAHSPDAPDATAIPATTAPDDTDADTASSTPSSRTYRKPVQPRRPKGELRAAVIAVLKAAPNQPFKVSEVCKAIDAANADSASNKAGAGAVANALDKLVGSGDAVRIEDAKYATYQAAP
ncbi:MAG TPA: hypothetical protein VF755_22000 [Catenuloplanes sp.]